MMTGADEVLLERHGHVAVVRLNRAERSNAITPAMAGLLVDQLRAVSADDELRALVLASSGSVFCAGADRTVLRGALSVPVDDGPIRAFYDVVAALRAVPVPLLAAVEGAAVGAGLNLVLACDVVVAGAAASFDSRFLRIGLHPGGGHTWLLRHALGAQQAAKLVLLGGPIDSAEAERIGLVTTVTSAGEAEAKALELATVAARTERELLVEAKNSLTVAADVGFESALEHELRRQLYLLGRPGIRESMAQALGFGSEATPGESVT